MLQTQKELVKRGLIAGTEESEAAFYQRVERAEKTALSDEVLAHLDEFGVSPDWVEVEIVTRCPFHMAAYTEVFTEKGVLSALVKIKKKFADESEVIAHELVHAMRVGFPSGKYEEVFAYRTSKSKWRRIFGPLFSDKRFMLSFLVGSFGPLFLVPWFGLWAFSALMFPILAGSHILYWTFKRVNKAIAHLSKYTKKPWGVILCLTDEEVEKVSCGAFESIKQETLRWQQIEELLTDV